MRLRLTEFRPRLGLREFRVVCPRRPLARTSLYEPTEWGWLVGDHDGLSRLAALFAFAATSPHTIVFVPMRDGLPKGEGAHRAEVTERVDLLLMHHSLQLRPSLWPAVRARLRGGRPLTADTLESKAQRSQTFTRHRTRVGFLDFLFPVHYAKTLMLVGARHSFEAAVGELAYTAGNGPLAEEVKRGASTLLGSLTPIIRPALSWTKFEIDISYSGPPRRRASSPMRSNPDPAP